MYNKPEKPLEMKYKKKTTTARKVAPFPANMFYREAGGCTAQHSALQHTRRKKKILLSM